MNELVAIGVGAAALSLPLSLLVVLRGTTPAQRPAILRALAEVFRGRNWRG